MTTSTPFARAACGLALAALLAACNGTPIGRPPDMTTIGAAGPNAPAILTAERAAIAVPPIQPARYSYQQASLWGTGPTNLLGDRRAQNLGDLLTVVIEIDDSAEMRNTTQRTRGGSEGLGVTEAFGIGGSKFFPNELEGLNANLDVESDSNFRGNGNTRRNEKLMLRVAATVVDVLPNG